MNRQKKEAEKTRQKLLLDITPIDSFSGAFRFLSNFWPCVIRYYELVFQSTEAAYQAAKSLDLEVQKKFEPLLPAEAKRLGNEIILRENWEEVKESVMFGLLFQKFSSAILWQRLRATAPRPLIEGNHWHDTYWGICNGKCRQGPHAPFGKNRLGEMLMEIRDGSM